MVHVFFSFVFRIPRKHHDFNDTLRLLYTRTFAGFWRLFRDGTEFYHIMITVADYDMFFFFIYENYYLRLQIYNLKPCMLFLCHVKKNKLALLVVGDTPVIWFQKKKKGGVTNERGKRV